MFQRQFKNCVSTNLTKYLMQDITGDGEHLSLASSACGGDA
jgi:hypothetical protein